MQPTSRWSVGSESSAHRSKKLPPKLVEPTAPILIHQFGRGFVHRAAPVDLEPSLPSRPQGHGVPSTARRFHG